MQAMLDRPIVKPDGIQPTLFSIAAAWQEGQSGEAAAACPPPSISRPGRLFSLGQRVLLKGGHQRRMSPATSRWYVAGISIPRRVNRSYRWAPERENAVITVGELDLHLARPELRIVEHKRWRADGSSAGHEHLLSHLTASWNCHFLAAGGSDAPMVTYERTPAGSLLLNGAPANAFGRACHGLMEMVDTGLLKMYARDGSPEESGFWAQIVKAQGVYAAGGRLDIAPTPSAGDDFLVSLALMVEAARQLRSRGQRSLLAAVPA